MTNRKALRRWGAILGVAFLAAACAPEIGSPEWCGDMKAKDKGEWTASEATEFAKNCVL